MITYFVDAFAENLFSGNPAAVCPLEKWLPDGTMQDIAMENNLAETAFFVKTGSRYRIRWFTPAVEVDLCGHATLASSHVLFSHLGCKDATILFDSNSGELKVTREPMLTLDFPVDSLVPAEAPQSIEDALGRSPIDCYKGKTDYLLVFETQAHVEGFRPDFKLIAKATARGIIVTAQGDKVDFVSRFFAPQSGIDEDPVTGSAHTTLTPYWAKKLGKSKLSALQVSKRGGRLECELAGERVKIGGKAITYMIGDVQFDGR
jgi:PhzF family phenazine biosynthesis protein